LSALVDFVTAARLHRIPLGGVVGECRFPPVAAAFSGLAWTVTRIILGFSDWRSRLPPLLYTRPRRHVSQSLLLIGRVGAPRFGARGQRALSSGSSVGTLRQVRWFHSGDASCLSSAAVVASSCGSATLVLLLGGKLAASSSALLVHCRQCLSCVVLCSLAFFDQLYKRVTSTPCNRPADWLYL
jgi:hypothetical protein